MKTTFEEAKENLHDNVVNNLQGLLEKNYDAEAGYKKAMENAKSDRLTGFLKRRAALRSQFANELDLEIRKLNETPQETGSTKASLHRTWMDMKSFMSGGSDEAVLEECIRGEKASISEYQETLQNQNFSPELTNLLTSQLDRVKTNLNEVKRLEDITDTMNM